MKKRETSKNIILIIFIVLVLLCVAILISGSITSLMAFYAGKRGLPDNQLSMTLSLIGAIVSAISLSIVVFQLHKGNKATVKASDIDEAQFLLQYNQTFIQDEKMYSVEQHLERSMINNSSLNIMDENRQNYINYLVYLEGLAPVILKGIMKLETIDDLMGYRFFLCVNNKDIQKDQLFVFPDYYKGCFKLYRFWQTYRKSLNEPILMENDALDKWIHFEKYAGTDVIVRALSDEDDKERVAELIYTTDPYIYPAAFSTASIARKVLPYLFEQEGLFNKKNIYVALIKNKIVGIAVVVNNQSDCDFDTKKLYAEFDMLPDSLDDVAQKYFMKIKQEISENAVYIACISVDRSFITKSRKNKEQKIRIGKVLLSNIVQENNDKAVCLDVLADNSKAISLYEECGFEKIGEVTQGYNYNSAQPLCYKMKRNG